jgi:hypothetical protein
MASIVAVGHPFNINILINNSVTHVCIYLTITCSLGTVMDDDEIENDKNAPLLLTILMALAIHWCNVECITLYGRSRATLDATGCRH